MSALERLKKQGELVVLLDGETSTGDGDIKSVDFDTANVYLHAKVQGTGAVSATVNVKTSIDGISSSSDNAATISLSGTGSDEKGVALTNPCPFWMGNVSAVSGTGAAVSLYIKGEK